MISFTPLNSFTPSMASDSNSLPPNDDVTESQTTQLLLHPFYKSKRVAGVERPSKPSQASNRSNNRRRNSNGTSKCIAVLGLLVVALCVFEIVEVNVQHSEAMMYFPADKVNDDPLNYEDLSSNQDLPLVDLQFVLNLCNNMAKRIGKLNPIFEVQKKKNMKQAAAACEELIPIIVKDLESKSSIKSNKRSLRAHRHRPNPVAGSSSWYLFKLFESDNSDN